MLLSLSSSPSHGSCLVRWHPLPARRSSPSAASSTGSNIPALTRQWIFCMGNMGPFVPFGRRGAAGCGTALQIHERFSPGSSIPVGDGEFARLGTDGDCCAHTPCAAITRTSCAHGLRVIPPRTTCPTPRQCQVAASNAHRRVLLQMPVLTIQPWAYQVRWRIHHRQMPRLVCRQSLQ